MSRILLSVHGALWGVPMLVLILGVGLQIGYATGFVQIRLFARSMKLFVQKMCRRNSGSGVSAFRAMCTALGATVGTGNIIGVAGALCLGGPGAIFWMWICGILAMGTKFAEATLAVRYRIPSGDTFIGGPMYMMTEGLGKRWKRLAALYCILGLAASFGVGNAAQIHAVISGINSVLEVWGIAETIRRNCAVGLILAVFLGSILLGGAGRIGAAAEILIPWMSVLYLVLCSMVLIIRRDFLAEAVCSIIRGALTPEAVTGGTVGSALQALKIGCCRGVFTNEAGMGTASMAHGSADVNHPVEQGMLGIVEVFLDTILLCTLTALVILVSGVPIPYGTDGGGTLALAAFARVCGNWARIVLTIALCCFAVAAVLGWGLYGVRCAQFLFGPKSWEPFALAQTAAVAAGAVMNTQTVWLLSELLNGLMAIPNLIVLVMLAPELARLAKEYIKKEGGIAAEGGNHADFHQCQPLRALSHEKVSPLCGGGGSAGKEDLSSEYRSA